MKHRVRENLKRKLRSCRDISLEENVYAVALELLEEIKKQKTKETERRKAKKRSNWERQSLGIREKRESS